MKQLIDFGVTVNGVEVERLATEFNLNETFHRAFKAAAYGDAVKAYAQGKCYRAARRGATTWRVLEHEWNYSTDEAFQVEQWLPCKFTGRSYKTETGARRAMANAAKKWRLDIKELRVESVANELY